MKNSEVKIGEIETKVNHLSKEMDVRFEKIDRQINLHDSLHRESALKGVKSQFFHVLGSSILVTPVISPEQRIHSNAPDSVIERVFSHFLHDLIKPLQQRIAVLENKANNGEAK